MAERSRFISQERMGMWVVVTLGIAILALVLAIVNMREIRLGVVVLETQAIKLQERVTALEKARSTQAAATAAAAEALAKAAEGAAPAPEGQEAAKK